MKLYFLIEVFWRKWIFLIKTNRKRFHYTNKNEKNFFIAYIGVCFICLYK